LNVGCFSEVYVFTYRTKGDVGDDPFKLCGFYDQTDVRGPLIDNELRKEGTEAVALLTQTSFTENEYSYTLVDKDASRIVFRDLLHTVYTESDGPICRSKSINLNLLIILLRLFMVTSVYKPIKHSPST
jgi:hypothetical protein